MRKSLSIKLFAVVAAIVIVSLVFGCETDDKGTGPTNGEPTTPVIDVAGGAPADSATGQPLVVTLRWTCTDPDGDSITYDVYFDTSATPSRVDSAATDVFYTSDSLDYETTYYWMITASDNAGHSVSSPVWQFTAIPPKGNEPTMPEIDVASGAPADSSEDHPLVVTLVWDCTDPDGDPVTYDVYFGADQMLTLVAADTSSNYYQPDTLDFGTTYFWKVVAKDNHGNSISSPLWVFSTVDYSVTWNRIFDEPKSGGSVAQTGDGGYVAAGTIDIGFREDVYLVKVDALGNTLWSTTVGGTHQDWPLWIAPTPDGGCIVTGYTVSFGVGNGDVYLIKTDAFGDTTWTQTYGGAESDGGNSVLPTYDGGFVVVGSTWSFGAGDLDVYLIKTNETGDIVWTRTFGGPARDEGYSVAQTGDGGYVVAGDTYVDFGSNPAAYLIKTDSLGIAEWTKTFAGANIAFARSISLMTDGGFVLAGATRSANGEDNDLYLIRTDAAGNSLWSKTYGGPEDEWASSVAQTDDGGLVVAGWTKSYGSGYIDAYLIETDISGDTVWTRTFGESGLDMADCVRLTTDGGYVMAGTWGSSSMFVTKTDSLGRVYE